MLETLEAWDGTVAEPRHAATVVVLRSTATGLEVFLMRRRASMGFAAGMYVFPGGSVQETDFDVTPWIGPAPETWGQRFSCEPQLAGALVVAAAREAFEETGILFAGPDESSVVGEVQPAEWTQARQALEGKEISFAELLRDGGLSLRADLLGAWAHWITPAFEPRRFDTRFFVASMPAGQSVGRLSSEADTGAWVEVGEAWRAARAGEMEMLPPTRHTIAGLARLENASVLEEAGRRHIECILPEVVEVDGRRSLLLPTDAQ
jgi:8-oxo-dGTP pyrophosphatase MutT (NUDIX family)